MTPDERQMISGLFDRVRAAESAPRDRDAEAYIGGRAKESPNAAYTLAQVVLVQEQALAAAQRRIEELEAQLRDAQTAPPAQQGGGFLSSFFGGSSPQAPAAPPPGGAWGRGAPSGDPRQGYGAPPPAGPWGGAPQQGFGGAPQQAWGGAPQQPARGGGFLSGALSTAAGVAGGMMLANSIQGLFKSDPHLASTAGQSHAAADLQGLGSDASNIWPSTPAGNDADGYQNAADDGGYDDGGDYDDGSSDV